MVEIRIAKKLLGANDEIAGRVRALFGEKGVLAVNVLGSPGAGKTALLEGLAVATGERARIGVVEGDLETARDAERMDRAGVKAVQITTGKACHLHAGMVLDALSVLDLDALDLLFIENVGNLVCPAGFDLGEDLRIVVASVTEGDDKPAKYPPIYAGADILAVNKTDLLPHVDFEMARFLWEAKKIRPSLEVFELSCRTGEGVPALADALVERLAAKRGGNRPGSGM